MVGSAFLGMHGSTEQSAAPTHTPKYPPERAGESPCGYRPIGRAAPSNRTNRTMKDRNGNDISIGDRVIVEGTITSISDTVVVVQDDQGDAFSIPGERVEKLVVEGEGDAST